MDKYLSAALSMLGLGGAAAKLTCTNLSRPAIAELKSQLQCTVHDHVHANNHDCIPSTINPRKRKTNSYDANRSVVTLVRTENCMLPNSYITDVAKSGSYKALREYVKGRFLWFHVPTYY